MKNFIVLIIIALIAYIGTSIFVISRSKDLLQSMLYENVGNEITVVDLNLDGLLFIDNVRDGVAILEKNNKVFSINIVVSGNGITQSIYTEIPGTEVLKLKMR